MPTNPYVNSTTMIQALKDLYANYDFFPIMFAHRMGPSGEALSREYGVQYISQWAKMDDQPKFSMETRQHMLDELETE